MGRGSSGAGTRSKGARASRGSGAGGGGAGGGSIAPGGRFGPSKARVEFNPDSTPAERRKLVQEAKRLFGPKFEVQDFASAVGAPDNSKVYINFTEHRDIYFGASQLAPGTGKFYATVHHPDIRVMERSVFKTKHGENVIKNEFFQANVSGTGLGQKIFGKQVENATKLGFKAIKTEAVRGEGFNGYSTWAKFGYNAKLTSEVRSKLPAGLKGARSIHELRQTAAGASWWDKHGDSTSMRFNLAPGSRSQKVLRDYLANSRHSQ